MNKETKDLWEFIGTRLEMGEKQYGGFKFGEYDLAQMSLEELADFVVYVMAKIFLKMKESK